tara:strand:- start:7865 stop:8128 length:264 start_codon:yes stop_codon:yes gene_type:complete
MSEKINNKNKIAILGFIGIGLAALFFFVGFDQENSDVTADITNIENNEEVPDITNEENPSEVSEITAEKIIENEDDHAVEIEENSNN